MREDNFESAPSTWISTKGTWALAILCALFFLVTSYNIASRRLLWFDELSTMRALKQPDVASLWRHLGHYGDSAPIVYHLLIRPVYYLSGQAEISPRIVSALAMVAAMLLVFDCARRICGGAHALIALFALGSSFLTYYGYEGRPYALVVLFTSIALWLWLYTEENSKLAAAAFGVTIFLLVGTHFNAVVAMAPFGVWELTRWPQRRKLSLKLLAGGAGMICMLALSLGQMKRSSGGAVNSWCPPSVRALTEVFGQMFPTGLLILAALVVLICLMPRTSAPIGDAERLCWLFLIIPVTGLIIAKAVTNNFQDRYLIAMLPGVAVAFGCFASRHLTKLATVALLLVLAASMSWRQMVSLHNAEEVYPAAAPDLQVHSRELLAAEDRLVADGKRVILTEVLLLDMAKYYSKRPELYFIFQGNETPGYCRYFASSCLTTDAIKSRAAEACAIRPTGKLLAEMKQAGFQATVSATDPMIVYFAPVSHANAQ